MKKRVERQEKTAQKQIFWYGMANYIAYGLGFFAFLFIYPNDLEFLGKIKFIETIGHLIYPFLLFGLAQSFVNFNPLLETYHAKTFFGNSMVFIAILSILAILGISLFDSIYHLNDFHYYYLGLIFAIALAYIELIKSRAVTINKVTLPVLLEKILPKVLLPILFFLLFKKYTTTENLLNAFSYGHYIIVFLMLLYVLQFTLPRFSVKPEHLFENFSRNDLLKFCLFSLMGSFGSLLAFRIDNFMIPLFMNQNKLGLYYNGLYSFAMMFSSLIAIPATGFLAVNGPKVSYLVKKNLIDELGFRYRETAKTLFFKGAILFSCIYIIVPDFIAQFVHNYHRFDTILPIITVLGIGVLVNIATGFNTEIITYSKYYKFNIVSIFALVIVNLGLCYYFLSSTTLGLMGVAIASTVSMCLYNIIKLYFIYLKFGILPFDSNYIKLIAMMTIILISVSYLPDTGNHFINFVYKSITVVLLNYTIASSFKLLRSENKQPE
jgi:O-antigen/teichoic acid export membrane protein